MFAGIFGKLLLDIAAKLVIAGGTAAVAKGWIDGSMATGLEGAITTAIGGIVTSIIKVRGDQGSHSGHAGENH